MPDCHDASAGPYRDSHSNAVRCPESPTLGPSRHPPSALRGFRSGSRSEASTASRQLTTNAGERGICGVTMADFDAWTLLRELGLAQGGSRSGPRRLAPPPRG